MKSSVGELLPILASLEGNDFAAEGVENSKNPSLHDRERFGHTNPRFFLISTSYGLGDEMLPAIILAGKTNLTLSMNLVIVQLVTSNYEWPMSLVTYVFFVFWGTPWHVSRMLLQRRKWHHPHGSDSGRRWLCTSVALAKLLVSLTLPSMVVSGSPIRWDR